MINKKRISSSFLKLLAFNSPSGSEKEIVSFLSDKLRGLGLSVSVDKHANILAKRKGTGKPFLLSAHTDTVESTYNQKVVFSRGVFKTNGDTILGADDKAGLAVIIEVLEILKEDCIETVPLEIVLTSSEEIGLVGAMAFDIKKLKAKKGLVLDLGYFPGRCATHAPCYVRLDIEVLGKASHSAVPQKGVNALKIAAEAISKIKLGHLDKESCMNFGIIEGEGKRNIIPENIKLFGESRSFDYKRALANADKTINIFKTIAKKYGGKIKFIKELVFKGYSFGQRDDILKYFKISCSLTNLKFMPSPSKGGSDANIFNTHGIEVLDIAVGTLDAHSKKESIKLSDMEKSVKLVLNYLNILHEK